MLITLFFLVNISISAPCKSEAEAKSIIKESTSHTKKSNQYYFDFDRIDHYSIDIDEYDLVQISINKSKNEKISEKEKLQLDIIYNFLPRRISDSSFIPKLESIGFTKNNINTEDFNSIKEIFKFKIAKESVAEECIAVFRDILVFRKSNRIVGITKICFDCGKKVILGTKVNSDDFGQDGDYEKLENILSK